MMAKMSSIDTRVSSSVMGAFFLFIDGVALGGVEMILLSVGESRGGPVGVPGRGEFAAEGVFGVGASKLCLTGT